VPSGAHQSGSDERDRCRDDDEDRTGDVVSNALVTAGTGVPTSGLILSRD